MSTKKPIDDAFAFMLEKLKVEGFKKLTNRVMVKETNSWLYFIQFTSILKVRTSAKSKNGFAWEVGAFLKGAKAPIIYADKEFNGYKDFQVKDAVGCHFRRYWINPPFLLGSYSSGGFSHALFWKYLRNINLKHLSDEFDKDITDWILRLEDLNEVKKYLDVSTEKDMRVNNKWGNFYGKLDDFILSFKKTNKTPTI